MIYFLSVGALNVLVNVAIWAIHAVCCALVGDIYARASSCELWRTGKTFATDASDVAPEKWLFGRKLRRWRALTWWAFVLLAALTVLIPVELLLEAGIGESSVCRPWTLRNSTGVCATAMAGGGYPLQPDGSDSEIKAHMVLIQNVAWADPWWDFVPVGASKRPRTSEVHAARYRPSPADRAVVVADCRVETAQCTGAAECGSVTVAADGGVFKTVVRNWTARAGGGGGVAWERGDLTWDTAVAAAFIFREAGSAPAPAPGRPNRTRIAVKGAEMVLDGGERAAFLKFGHPPFRLRFAAARSRRYRISCATDGLRARDLARAVSLFRTAVMEQPGVRHTEVRGALANLRPLDASDVAKAAYALKAERWADSCAGPVDVYRTCGAFNMWFVVPFGVMAGLIAAAWAAVRVACRRVPHAAPHDAESWREKAQVAMRKASARSWGPFPSQLDPPSDSMLGAGYGRGAAQPYFSDSFEADFVLS